MPTSDLSAPGSTSANPLPLRSRGARQSALCLSRVAGRAGDDFVALGAENHRTSAARRDGVGVTAYVSSTAVVRGDGVEVPVCAGGTVIGCCNTVEVPATVCIAAVA